MPCDDAHRATLSACPSWRRLGAFVGEEVQARQELNAEHAAAYMPYDQRPDYLLHIDADELFHPGLPSGGEAPSAHAAADDAGDDADALRDRAQAHFNSLLEQDIPTYTYANYEGLP